MNQKLFYTSVMAISFVVAGCQWLSIDHLRTVRHLKGVDTVSIRGNDSNPKIITDPQSIQRLRAIYQHTNWQPYIATMPSFQMSLITYMSGTEEVGRVLFLNDWLLLPQGWQGRVDKETADWLGTFISESSASTTESN